MPSNSLPDAALNLPEMKTKSPSRPAGGVHMYESEISLMQNCCIWTYICIALYCFWKKNVKIFSASVISWFTTLLHLF